MNRNSFKKIVSLMAILIISLVSTGYGGDMPSTQLDGIFVDMKKGELIANWGHPSKRDLRNRDEIWFYILEKTPHPTDGIEVYLKRGRVQKWQVSDNIYTEMAIWGKGLEGR